MVEKSRKQTKEEERKAARKAEKQAKKEANKAKVEATKAEKAVKAAKAKTQPKKVEDTGPVVRKVKDIWEALDLEKKGIHVNENGEYTIDTSGKATTSEGKVKAKRRGRRHVKKIGHHRMSPRVCVVTKEGEHVRVHRTIAAELVAKGGRYIPKWQYEGKVNGEPVDWSHKKGKGKL